MDIDFLVQDVNRSAAIAALQTPPTRIVGAPDKPTTLTKRELEVVRLIASGQTAYEIGATLDVSTRTIEFHTQGIFDKLGVRRKLQAVNEARKRGLI